MSDVEPTQERLFDPTRYSPVSVAVILRLPQGEARSFWVASALGRWLDHNGTSERLRNGKWASGSLITPKRRPVILGALGIDERRWRRLVKTWEERKIAHRCQPGSVFLFTQFLGDECAACHAPIYYDETVSPVRNRGVGFGGMDRFDPTEGTDLTLSSGTTRPSPPALLDPHSERNRVAPKNRFLQGLEVGTPLTTEEEEAFLLAETLLKSRSEIAPQLSEIEEAER